MVYECIFKRSLGPHEGPFVTDQSNLMGGILNFS
jgi:hypothetical protein